MTAQQSAGTPPEASTDQAPPQPRSRRRPAVRWIVHGVLLVALAAGIFGVLPRLGGLTRDAAGLRHARPAFLAAATTGEAIALTSLTSTIALIVLFGTGFVATAGRHVSHQYLLIAGIVLVLVATALAAVLAVGAHPAVAGRAGRWTATVARHVRPGIDPAKAGQTASRLASLARTALSGRAFAVSFGFASGDLLFDLLSLDLVFLALRYQPGFGPLAVAYAAANIASAIPLTPGGLGVIEVTLVAVSVGFGAPRATAVLAVLGYRIVNYWLPLIPGAIAYLRLRLRNKPPPAHR
ncbi:MAG TPA: flippase-like domain-containing protein [Streptosporangiaceae bacterium]|nr:flippase-like domain-containing protein [Streptosporangiaceae bacterium]